MLTHNICAAMHSSPLDDFLFSWFSLINDIKQVCIGFVTTIITCSEAWESTSLCFKTCPIHDTARYHEGINQHNADLVNEWGSVPPSYQARAWQHFKSTWCRFLAVVLKGNTQRHGSCIQNAIMGDVQHSQILQYTDWRAVYNAKQQWWLYAVVSTNCMSQMEWRDRWGHQHPPMALHRCWPHLRVLTKSHKTALKSTSIVLQQDT